jgi:hypothetical protein
MNDDEGMISILSAGMEEIDKFHYNDKMHYPLLTDVEGVALERIRANGATNDVSNWHSASYQSGYGTPGSKNSQSIEANTTNEEVISIEPPIISPDNDGHNDMAVIKIRGNTGTGTIKIFDETGKEIKTIAEGEYLGNENEYVWDGSNNRSAIVAVGIYIVVSEITKENGDTEFSKRSIVVAQKSEIIN